MRSPSERLSLAACPEQLRTLLQLAVIVWNAMLDTSGEPEDDARRMIARMQSKFWTPPPTVVIDWLARRRIRSEEHTSELQSRLHLVCRLLLEKKKYKDP